MKQTLALPRGAIFDWDGVIVDSARQHLLSWERLAEEYDLHLPDGHFEESFGMRNEQIIPDLLEWTRDPQKIADLSRRKEEWFRHLVREDGLEPLSGVVGLLESLRQAGIPMAVGSSTSRANIACCLEILGIEDFFHALVTSEDVRLGKPDPEVFLLAADRLGADAAECVVFEDAPVGITAGKAGGMKVVGLTTTHPADHIADADRVVDLPGEITLSLLAGLFTA